MNISNITPPQVWTSSSRSLTNFGSSALAATPTVFTAIAGAASVDLRPSAGTVASMSVSVVTGVGATSGININMFDGTNQILMAGTAAAATSPAAFSSINTNSVGVRLLNNDATHAGSYMVSQYTLTI